MAWHSFASQIRMSLSYTASLVNESTVRGLSVAEKLRAVHNA
jgi:hypothetical protein